MEDNITIAKTNHPLFGEIDSVTTPDGKVWYKGREVAASLGYRNPHYVVRTLTGTLPVVTGYQTPNGCAYARPVPYVDREHIKTLILRRTAMDIKKCCRECIRKIELI